MHHGVANCDLMHYMISDAGKTVVLPKFVYVFFSCLLSLLLVRNEFS